MGGVLCSQVRVSTAFMVLTWGWLGLTPTILSIKSKSTKAGSAKTLPGLQHYSPHPRTRNSPAGFRDGGVQSQPPVVRNRGHTARAHRVLQCVIHPRLQLCPKERVIELRLSAVWIIQLQAEGPDRTCNESNKEEEEASVSYSPSSVWYGSGLGT